MAEAPVAAEVVATAMPAATAAATATATTTAPIAQPTTEATPRPTSRGRRGGGNRRRASKPELPDIQLVPVISATEPEPAAETSTEHPLAETRPAREPLALDTAILAHLDAISHASVQQTATEESAPATSETHTEAAPSASRRYRFDRPRGQETPASATVRTERLSGWRATPPTLMTTPPAAEATAPVSEEPQPGAEVAPVAEAAEAVTPTVTLVEPEAAETPEEHTAPENAEETSVVAESAPEAATTEAAEEEQGEHDGAARRRRRRGRGRSGRAQDAEGDEGEQDERRGRGEPPSTRVPAPYAAPETAISYARDYESSNGYLPGIEGIEGYEEPGYGPYTPAPRTRGTSHPAAQATRRPEAPWSMSTAQQHVQEPAGPFGSPEPSFARGFGPQTSGVAAPLHETQQRTRRSERSGDTPISANQLGTLITNAITQQTDRLLTEFRRQQYPPSMTVALPAFPSTERIGVFVDVANLLYSARSQRMSIDFGRLLDFLRGNRRLIRAHAYAPTNPDPHAEQTFLSAVKGVGYRITTKNYKTFASGARKADMDLDLCMDIVRLVDAGTLDTVVLVSGDSDFLPLLEYCSDHGVRVEVAAFDDAAAMILRQSCDLFINLSQVDEIRA